MTRKWLLKAVLATISDLVLTAFSQIFCDDSQGTKSGRVVTPLQAIVVVFLRVIPLYVFLLLSHACS